MYRISTEASGLRVVCLCYETKYSARKIDIAVLFPGSCNLLFQQRRVVFKWANYAGVSIPMSSIVRLILVAYNLLSGATIAGLTLFERLGGCACSCLRLRGTVRLGLLVPYAFDDSVFACFRPGRIFLLYGFGFSFTTVVVVDGVHGCVGVIFFSAPLHRL